MPTPDLLKLLLGAASGSATRTAARRPGLLLRSAERLGKHGVLYPTAYWDQKVLRAAMEAAKNPLNRERLVWMPPDQFLKLALPLEKPLTPFSESKLQKLRELLERGIGFNEIPYLSFRHDSRGVAQVLGHEGRHRAITLRDRGVDLMPVMLESRNTKRGVKGLKEVGPVIRWGAQRTPDSIDRIEGVWPFAIQPEVTADTGRLLKRPFMFPIPDLRLPLHERLAKQKEVAQALLLRTSKPKRKKKR